MCFASLFGVRFYLYIYFLFIIIFFFFCCTLFHPIRARLPLHRRRTENFANAIVSAMQQRGDRSAAERK
jgi:hypothetical protein